VIWHYLKSVAKIPFNCGLYFVALFVTLKPKPCYIGKVSQKFLLLPDIYPVSVSAKFHDLPIFNCLAASQFVRFA